MKGLIIRAPWIDLILSGKKTWEMRSRPTSSRGKVALIRAGSGLICGTATLVECLPAQTPEQMRATTDRHAIPAGEIDTVIGKGWTTPWVLSNVCHLVPPVPYKHPFGAVTWVNLPTDILISPSNVLEAGDVAAPKTKPASESDRRPTEKHPISIPPVGHKWVDVRLTDGNLKNGHIYLRAAEHLLPADCIGGPNKATLAATIRVRFQPGEQIETDVAGDKMIFRARGPVRDFFARTGARAGNVVRISRVGERDFVVAMAGIVGTEV